MCTPDHHTCMSCWTSRSRFVPPVFAFKTHPILLQRLSKELRCWCQDDEEAPVPFHPKAAGSVRLGSVRALCRTCDFFWSHRGVVMLDKGSLSCDGELMLQETQRRSVWFRLCVSVWGSTWHEPRDGQDRSWHHSVQSNDRFSWKCLKRRVRYFMLLKQYFLF